MKQCKTCCIKKPISEFSKKGSGLQSACKSCGKAYSRAYYNRYKSSWIKYQNKKKQWAIDNPEEAKLENKKRYATTAEKQKAYQKQRYMEDPKRAKSNSLKKYGITLNQFEKLKLKQNGKCAICETELNHALKTHVDHCHKTNVVRGILCNLCNPGLGMFKDSTEILKCAILYLDKHSNKE